MQADADLARAVALLQLQYELIQSQQLEIATLRTERDQARMIQFAIAAQDRKLDQLLEQRAWSLSS